MGRVVGSHDAKVSSLVGWDRDVSVKEHPRHRKIFADNIRWAVRRRVVAHQVDVFSARLKQDALQALLIGARRDSLRLRTQEVYERLVAAMNLKVEQHDSKDKQTQPHRLKSTSRIQAANHLMCIGKYHMERICRGIRSA